MKEHDCNEHGKWTWRDDLKFLFGRKPTHKGCSRCGEQSIWEGSKNNQESHITTATWEELLGKEEKERIDKMVEFEEGDDVVTGEWIEEDEEEGKGSKRSGGE